MKKNPMKQRLMKQEIRETKKMLLCTMGYTVVLSTITLITAAVAEIKKSVTAGNLMVVFMLCSMMGIVLAGAIMIGRVYNLLFTEEGKIRLTLPVQNSAHLQTNVKLGVLSIYLEIFLLCAILGIMDKEDLVFGLFGSYLRAYKEYYGNIMMEHVGLKAFVTTLSITLAAAVVIANVYISFVFMLAVSRRIVSGFGIVQKRGVIFIIGTLLFDIQILAMWGLTCLVDVIEDAFAEGPFRSGQQAAYLSWIDSILYDPEKYWIKDVFAGLLFFVVYGITAIMMYRISRNIMDRKLEV